MLKGFLEFKKLKIVSLWFLLSLPKQKRMKHIHPKLGWNINYFPELSFFPFLQPASLVSSNLAYAMSRGTCPPPSKPSLSKWVVLQTTR